MTRRVSCFFGAIAFLIVTRHVAAELEPKCTADSPERRGEIGCSYVDDKPLPGPLKEPLFWHIDRFGSGPEAQAAAGPTSVAFSAHGSWWLMTIESTVEDHHGGEHVATVELPRLPPAEKYSLLVISAYVPAGLTSRVHHHSGVEAFYTVDGEQCLETPYGAHKIPKGESFAVPAGVTMRLVATGPTARRGLAIILYDASQPPTTATEELAPQLAQCR